MIKSSVLFELNSLMRRLDIQNWFVDDDGSDMILIAYNRYILPFHMLSRPRDDNRWLTTKIENIRNLIIKYNGRYLCD